MHVCEREMLFKATTSQVPKFNRTVFNSSDSSKQEVGSVNEIMGPFNQYVCKILILDVFCGSWNWSQ